MPPLDVLTHAAAALAGAALVWLLLRSRHQQALRDAGNEIETLRGSLQRARDEAEALRPQAMQALQLETTLTLSSAEHRRVETEIRQALEASRRRLAETEAMAASLQQALVDARREAAPQVPPAGIDPRLPAKPPADSDEHAPSRSLEELRSRVLGIISASRKWQRGSGPHAR